MGLRFKFVAKFIFLAVGAILLTSCGRAYFPIELKNFSRPERAEKQQEKTVKLIALNTKNIRKANRSEYERQLVDIGDFYRPARPVFLKEYSELNLPVGDTPGKYKIGPGDVIEWTQLLSTYGERKEVVSGKVVVNEDGFINILGLGRIKADTTQDDLEKAFATSRALVGENTTNFGFSITAFNSKKITFSVEGDKQSFTSIPYTNIPVYLSEVLLKLGTTKDKYGSEVADFRVKIVRGEASYEALLSQVKLSNSRKIRIFPGDRISLMPILYRKEYVFIVGETGSQTSIGIDYSQRPSLSELLFNNNILNKVTSDFSQVYVLREQKNEITYAYHLDITNPSRITLANSFKMHPNDVIFVATQPLSLYSRTLAQILGSANLTIQARDRARDELR